jgi:cysteine sulfinate desulfinase/cysteine desulfurase-like protein
VRIGATRTTTDAEIDRFLEVLPPIIAELRATVSVR